MSNSKFIDHLFILSAALLLIYCVTGLFIVSPALLSILRAALLLIVGAALPAVLSDRSTLLLVLCTALVGVLSGALLAVAGAALLLIGSAAILGNNQLKETLIISSNLPSHRRWYIVAHRLCHTQIYIVSALLEYLHSLPKTL